jgi:hypothetical protein
MATNSAFASRFNEAKFRDAIRQTMRMGMPPTVAEQLTWYFKREKTYASEDPTHTPYDLTATPVTDVPSNSDLADADPNDQGLVVDYAIEFSARPATSVSTVLGEIDASRGVVTVFDVDYASIATADYAKLGESTYRIQLVEPAIGLFGVAMYTIIIEAVDEA